MHNSSVPHPHELIREARAGDRQSLSDLISSYRPYLKLLTRLQHDDRLKAKLDDSDLVQEVATLAVRDFTAFRGETEAEFTCWLRAIMARVAAKSVRHFTMQRRHLKLERQFQSAIDQTSCLLADKLAGDEPTPSEHALARERAVLVAQALDQLPQRYREVVILRDFEGLSPQQIAQLWGRTPDAICKLWARAIVKMRKSLEGKV